MSTHDHDRWFFQNAQRVRDRIAHELSVGAEPGEHVVLLLDRLDPTADAVVHRLADALGGEVKPGTAEQYRAALIVVSTDIAREAMAEHPEILRGLSQRPKVGSLHVVGIAHGVARLTAVRGQT